MCAFLLDIWNALALIHFKWLDIIVIVKNTFLKYYIFIFTFIVGENSTSNGFSKILLKFEQPQVCIVFCEPKNPLCLLWIPLQWIQWMMWRMVQKRRQR